MVARARRAIECGRVRVRFAARRDMQATPVVQRNTPRGVLRIASAEATALELVGYAEASAGLGQVATVLRELAEAMDSTALAAEARRAPLAWVQRLGYLLEQVGGSDRTDPLADYVRAAARETTLLDPPRGPRHTERVSRWKLAVNADVVSDL